MTNFSSFELNYYSVVYIDFFFFIILTSIICFIILLACYIIAHHNSYTEKLTGYECGFDPFSDARDPFDIKFYLVSILFILFDIELLYFFPWVACFLLLNKIGFFSMYLFFVLLIIGFFYEWKKKALSF